MSPNLLRRPAKYYIRILCQTLDHLLPLTRTYLHISVSQKHLIWELQDEWILLTYILTWDTLYRNALSGSRRLCSLISEQLLHTKQTRTHLLNCNPPLPASPMNLFSHDSSLQFHEFFFLSLVLLTILGLCKSWGPSQYPFLLQSCVTGATCSMYQHKSITWRSNFRIEHVD